MPPRRAADILHDLFCRLLHRPGFLSHLRSLKGYDEPEILPSSTRRICLIGADAGHPSQISRSWRALSRNPSFFGYAVGTIVAPCALAPFSRILVISPLDS